MRYVVENRRVLLEKIDTLKNVAYFLTKFMSTDKFFGVEREWAL